MAFSMKAAGNAAGNSSGSFAREVEGLQLWETLDDLTVARLADAWSRHGVLIFRRQAISEDELVAFSGRFGDPDVIVRADWKSDNRPEIIQISNMKDYHGNSIGGLGAGELDWHTDQSYVMDPATGSVLYMVEMPKEPPVTYWANLQLAYDALPAPKKAKIDELSVIYDYFVRQSTYDDEPEMSEELRRKTPAVTHPLVNTHPITGDRSLYLDPTTAAGIAGWELEAGKDLLLELTEHATRPEFVYPHQWQIGDVVMWDNGFLMHRRDAFEPTKNRLLKRATLRLPSARHIVPIGALAA
jgi:taurine dioxygenase